MRYFIIALLLVFGACNALSQGTTPTFQVKTIADLIATPIPTINNRLTALVTGRVSTNDGGGGIFVYDIASATATNLGTVFKPSGSAGRWIRQYSGALNVAWFGAVGDGSTDSHMAITNAIEVAGEASSVFFPGFTYAVNKEITSNHRVSMHGESQASTIAYKGSTAIDSVLGLLGTSNITQIRLSNLTITGNANSQVALKLSNVLNSDFRNLSLWGVTQAGLMLDFCLVSSFKNIAVTTNVFPGVLVPPAYGIIVSNNANANVFIEPNLLGVTNVGMVFRASSQFNVVQGGAIEDTQTGMEFSTASNWNTVIGTDFELNRTYDVFFNSDSPNNTLQGIQATKVIRVDSNNIMIRDSVVSAFDIASVATNTWLARVTTPLSTLTNNGVKTRFDNVINSANSVSTNVLRDIQVISPVYGSQNALKINSRDDSGVVVDISLIPTSASAGSIALSVTNTTDNTGNLANFINNGSGSGIFVQQNALINALTKHALDVISTVAQTNSSLVKFNMSSASATQPLLELNQGGSGSLITGSVGGGANFIIDGGANMGLGTSSPGSVAPPGVNSPRTLEIRAKTATGNSAVLSLRRFGDDVVGFDLSTEHSNVDHHTYLDNRYELAGFIFRVGTRTGSGTNVVNISNGGNVVLNVAGMGLQIKEGSNARMGATALVNGTVTVANTSVTASTRIFLTRGVRAGTTVGILGVGTVTAATSFVIESTDLAGALSADDDSTVNWLLIEPSP